MALVFIRLDKIGDLVATMSVDQHPSLKNTNVIWFISKGLKWVAEKAIPPRNAIEISSSKSEWKTSYRQLLSQLRQIQPAAVVVFQAPWWVSLACWRADIPLRVSRASQWHSFIFFNHRLRQTRSRSEKHESEYNQELLEFALELKHEKISPFKLQVAPDHLLLKKYELQDNQYCIVHPGMFGSALNWPQQKYNELIEQLVKTQIVVITGTPNDERFLSEIKPRWENHPSVRILQGQLSFEELLSLLSTASSVIAPSTGVLHLAAALGKKSVGLYSPILAHHPRRWGPLGDQASFLLPPVDCPAKINCLGEKCSYYPCMNLISVESVLQKLNEKPNR